MGLILYYRVYAIGKTLETYCMAAASKLNTIIYSNKCVKYCTLQDLDEMCKDEKLG